MPKKTVRLLAANRPQFPREWDLQAIRSKLASIGYKISIHELHLAWTDYSRAKHPQPIHTDDGAEWVFAEPPERPQDIYDALRPFVTEAPRRS